MWESLCHMIGKEEWLTDPGFRTKEQLSSQVDAIEAELQRFFTDKTVSEAMDACVANRIPASPVKTVLEASTSDYISLRDVQRVVDTPYGSTPVLGDPWHFSSSTVRVSRPPTVGEHTKEVMSGLGNYSEPEIEELARQGVIR